MNKLAFVGLVAVLSFAAPMASYAQMPLTGATLDSSIGGQSFETALGLLDKATHVQVYKLSGLGDIDKAALAKTLADRAEEIKSLQTRLEGNQQAMQDIKDAGASLAQVVTITGKDLNDVTVYVNDL